MLKKHIPANAMPESLNCDFELAAINAFRKTFGLDKDIHGCFFHLSQALYESKSRHRIERNLGFRSLFGMYSSVSKMTYQERITKSRVGITKYKPKVANTSPSKQA